MLATSLPVRQKDCIQKINSANWNLNILPNVCLANLNYTVSKFFSSIHLHDLFDEDFQISFGVFSCSFLCVLFYEMISGRNL